MKLLQKIILLITGYNVLASKSQYFDYDYEPHRSYHLPWTIKYRQPLLSIDGAWPIAAPAGIYPYPYQYQIPKDEDYHYDEFNYQQELLTQSLNRALSKVNKLLAPLSLNSQETTPYPPSTKPEVLAEALNKAIDRLCVLLTREKQPLPLNNKPTVTAEISGSINSAIDDLNKLFATLPDELKAKPGQNNNNNQNDVKPLNTDFKPVKPVIPTQSMPEPNVNDLLIRNQGTTTEGKLFTSNIFEETSPTTQKTLEKNNEIVPFTSIPDISNNFGTSTEKPDENGLFTSLVSSTENSDSALPTEVNSDTSTELPTEVNSDTSTALPTEENGTELPTESVTVLPTENEGTTISEITTSENDVTTPYIPQIDIRFKEKEGDLIIFPDEFEKMTKRPLQIIELANRFQGKPVSTVKVSPAQSVTPITLDYKPSRPPFHPDAFPPHPSQRPQFDPNLQTTLTADIYKQTTVLQENQQPENNNQNPQIVLDYKPSRPPFHPDIFPPHPSPRPQFDPNLQTTLTADINKHTTVVQQNQQPVNNNQNPQIVLDYKPTRPPFHADVFPPLPSQRPQTESNPQSTNFELGDRNKPNQSNTNVQSTATTTEIIFTTTQNNAPYHPTHYYSTPLSLEYKPTRPFYAPNPVFYPKPIIRPGTPWPASSTEKTV